MFMYVDCGWIFVDDEGEDIPLESVLIWCEEGDEFYGLDGAFAQCVALLIPINDCDSVPDCL